MRQFVSLFFAALVLVSAVSSARAQVTAHSNSAPITINIGGAATPYPSVLNVTGATTSISNVRVALNGFTHTFPSDVQVLLVSPTGQKVLLMAGAGLSFPTSDLTVQFASDAAIPVPAPIVPGIYRPTVVFLSTFASPAPAGPYSSDLTTLHGLNANGTWTLYVFDTFGSLDSGAINNGWSIIFNEPGRQPEPIGTAFTYQGRLTGVPADSTVFLRFGLWNDPNSTDAANRIGSPVIRTATLADNVFSTSLDFGLAIQQQVGLYLNIEVATAGAGGPWTTLTPRQLLAGAPLALQLKGVTVDASNRVGIGGVNAPGYALDVGGRTRIRGIAGASGDSPGIWFASTASNGNLLERSFFGQRDDENAGIFTGGDWRLRVNANGNTWLGDGTGTAPPERLTVTGNMQLNTSGRLQFGAVGDFAGTAENSDAVFFQRVNTSTPGVSNVSTLRLALGDDGLTPASVDALSIGFVAGVSGTFTERIRLQSDGTALRPGGGTWAALSDPRAKHDVAPLSGTLDKLLTLRGYSFLYNDDRIAKGLARPGPQIGLMADEVARIFPDWVSTDDAGTLYVTERATTALMVEALRDLRREKDAELSRLREQNEQLQRRLEAIEKRLGPPEK